MNKQWTDEEIFELIYLYEETEFLWNVNHKFHRKRDKKMNTYEEFGRKFNCNSNEVQRKIHNLRNQISHELNKMKKLNSGDGADDRYESKWKFFSALQFITPYLTPRRTTANMKNAPENSESLENEPKPTPTSTLTSTLVQQSKKKSYKRQTQDDDDVLEEAIEVIKKPKDDFDRFGDYVALELKTLKSDYYRGLLKSEIRKAIANISDMDEKCHWSGMVPSPSSTNISSSSTPLPSSTAISNTVSPSLTGR